MHSNRFKIFLEQAELFKKIEEYRVDREQELVGLVEMEEQIKKHDKVISNYIQMPKYLVPFLHTGRLLRVGFCKIFFSFLIKIVAGSRDFGWGVLVNFTRKANPDNPAELMYILQVLIPIDPDYGSSGQSMTPSSIKPAALGTKVCSLFSNLGIILALLGGCAHGNRLHRQNKRN